MKGWLPVLVLVATVGLAGAAAAHVSEKAPIVHHIDHLRWETNALRRAAGLRAIRTTFEYRRIQDRAYRLWAESVWTGRRDEARNLLPKAGSVWARLAECESGGDWDYNGSDIFDGGLQFHPETWTSYRLRSYPRYAWQATPRQQIKVAERVLAAQGWAAWPACSSALGLR